MNGVTIIDPHSGAPVFLKYPLATVWDLVACEYPFPRIVRMVSAIAAISEPEAERLVRGCLAEWARSGFLTMEEGIG